MNILYCVKMNGGCPTPCIARNGRTTFVKSPVTTASGAPNAPAPITAAANNTTHLRRKKSAAMPANGTMQQP